MLFAQKDPKLDTKACVDRIEAIVYEAVKSLGFRKFGRTLHRFVDGDISQVIHFQNGCPQKGVYDVLWINLGIRVPECAERYAGVTGEKKKYYHEYECSIRTTLGELLGEKDQVYDLRKDPEAIGRDVQDKLMQYVLPVYDVITSREAVLANRELLSEFDHFGYRRMVDVEEALIYARRGEVEQAAYLFNRYYRAAREEYLEKLERGEKRFLRKGERLTYRNQKTGEVETVVGTGVGRVTLYNASNGHLSYLEELAARVGIPLEP